MATRHEKRIKELSIIAEAVEPVGAARIAAAIVIKNNLVAAGTNKRKTSPFQKRFGRNPEAICSHAEVDAIKNALRHIPVDDLAKATLYVARVKKDKAHGKFVQGFAKPCEGCQRAIATFKIKNVYYTLNDEGYDFL